MSSANKSHECLICFKPLLNQAPLFAQLFYQDVICFKCRSQLPIKAKQMKLKGYQVTTYYQFNDFFRSCFYRYKYFYDEALSGIFLGSMYQRLNKEYHDYLIIYFPESESYFYQAGYQPLNLILKPIGLPLISVFDLVVPINMETFRLRESQKMIYQNKKLLLVTDLIFERGDIFLVADLLEPNVKVIKVLGLALKSEIDLSII